MVEQAGAPPSDAETSLADSRAQFVASLGRRLEALRQALFALEQAPKSAALRDHLRRRIHAFGAAAGVLGFDRVFDAFREAEAVLGRTTSTTLGSAELGLVARTVDLVPSLVLGAASEVARSREAGVGGLDRRGAGWPTSVLVFGAPSLAEPLERGQASGDAAGLEYERADESEQAESIVRLTAPDVAVIDADLKGARELMETLVYDPLLDPVRIIAVGTFDRPEAAASLVALGVARVLPRPVSPDTLRRSVLEVARERAAPPERIDPIGDVTIEALGERIAHELRRGLVDAVKAQGRAAHVPLGAGTDVLAAVWSAVARIRELVTLRSGGLVRFDPSGPEGAVPLAPWMGDERSRAPSTSENRSADGVSLEGRTVIVVDDDPAVVWFISGLLRAGGAEVIEAHDGAYALDIARKCSPDVVVSDILMPGLDGFALCREIKRDVALSDVPVILLSWKEDLLQRVRELGADAEGYLRKEATASTVVQRVREVLLPRARIEARLAEGGAARGRLDGLTPRLILELVCEKSVDARLTLRDAAYLYEIDVRRGRVRTATRTSADGRFDRGSRALSALLGVRAGRFTVTHDESPCVQIWDADLPELIGEHVDRARAAQRALSQPARVAQVEIEEGALEPYLLASPLSAAAIVRRLAEGVPPGDIVAAGASPRLLESVLVDLVLHGAITRIVGFDGEDLLGDAMESLDQRRASVQLPDAKEFRTPGPPSARLAGLAFAPAAEQRSDAMRASAPAKRRDSSGFDDWEVASRPTPVSEKPRGADELFAMLGESMVPPPASLEDRGETGRISMKGVAPPTSLPAEPSPLEKALRSLPDEVAPKFWKNHDEAEKAEPPAADAPKAVAAALPAEAEDAAASAAPEPETPPAAGEREAGDAFVAALSEPDAPAAIELDGELAAAVATVEVDGEPAPAAVSSTEVDGEPAQALAEAVGTKTAVSPVMVLPMPGPLPAEDTATETEEPSESAAPAAADGATPFSEPSSVLAAAITAAADDRPITPRAGTPAVAEVEVAGTPSTAATAADGKDGKDSPGAAPELELGEAVASAIGGDAPRTQPSAEPRPVEVSGVIAPRAARTTPPVGKGARVSGQAATHQQTPAVPPREGGDATNILVIIAVMAVAAFATFEIVTAVRNGVSGAPTSVASSETTADTASPSASPPPVAEVTSGAPASVQAPMLRAVDMDLPPGLAVSQDRGLLEVGVDATQSVYVDGVFIGKGPLRQVPLREGAHEIRIQADNLDVVQPIEVRRGRRTHVEVSRTP